MRTEHRIEFHKLVDGRRTARFHVHEDVSASVEKLLRQDGYEQVHHGNCRSVVVLGLVDTETYAERIKNHGAKPIGDKDRCFASARAASQHFGVNKDAVSIALKRAKDRGEDLAVVVGVTIGWVDEVGGN